MMNSLWVGGFFVAGLVSSVLLTGLVRLWVVSANLRQTVREDGPESHLKKSGTPTLGGVGILGALALLTLALWWIKPVPTSPAVLLILALALTYGAVGFADDFWKLRFKRPLGLKARERVPLECLLALGFGLALRHYDIPSGSLSCAAQLVPWGTGLLWLAVVVFMGVGGGNAVNLTDGLDGLAGGVTCFCSLGLAGACLLLHRPDLAMLASALAGACAGFLWYNSAPASIFMGDVGSLGLGAALAGIAVAARLEILLGLFGLVFVIETLSVAIQVLYFKASRGKRIFRMAPFHHHLELGGMAETKIVIRFWLITIALAATGIGLVAILVRGAS